MFEVKSVNSRSLHISSTSSVLSLLPVDSLELSKVIETFNQHGLASLVSDRHLSVSELVSHVASLLTPTSSMTSSSPAPTEAPPDEEDRSKDVDEMSLATDLVVNWLLNVFDQ